MDGKETTNFYLGKYYIKEIKSPTGYIKDQEKHEVELTWDTTAGSINDIRDDDKVPDKEDPFGNEDNNVSTGIYVLEKGEKIEPEDQGCGICDFHVEECTRRSCDNGCFSE